MKYTDFAIRGIDVSQFNGTVDWSKVKADFTVIRVGHGRVIDPKFKANWAGAKGKTFRLPYWYMDYYSHRDPTTSAYGLYSDAEWGRIQAEKNWNAVKDDPSGIVFLDIESASVADKPVNEVWDRVEVIARAFLERADELSGTVNGIYCSLSLTSAFSEWFRNRPLWVAWYNEEQTPESVIAAVSARGWTGKVLIWQYASHGDADGDGKPDGQSMGMAYKFLDLNAWIAGADEWQQFKRSEKVTDILLNIPPLAQRDPKWKDIQLGTSSVTIGGYGCLITCASMMCRYFGIDIDPAGMNAWLKANNGYQNSNWFVWSSLNKLDPRISFGYRYQYAALDKIDAELAAGRPVIINVDMVPGTPVMDEHWVLVVGKVGGSYIINDPWTGDQIKFEDRYGSPSKGIYIVSTYKFTGTPAPLPPDEPEPLPEGKVRALVNLNIRKGAGTSYARWATAPKGTILDVLETQGDWVRVGWQQWCMSNYNGVRYLE